MRRGAVFPADPALGEDRGYTSADLYQFFSRPHLYYLPNRPDFTYVTEISEKEDDVVGFSGDESSGILRSPKSEDVRGITNIILPNLAKINNS
jgi:hypothetical protein